MKPDGGYPDEDGPSGGAGGTVADIEFEPVKNSYFFFAGMGGAPGAAGAGGFAGGPGGAGSILVKEYF